MPVPTDRDRKALETFAADTISLVGSLVTKHMHVFPALLQPEIAAAWKEFQEDFNQPEFLAAARKVPHERAVWAGLYGAQLRLKLSVVRYWRVKWNLSFSSNVLLRLLDAIDTVLDSLIVATGLGEALKELKDILRNSIDDDT